MKLLFVFVILFVIYKLFLQQTTQTDGSLQFFGGTQTAYVEYPVNTIWYPGTKSFTIEAWLKVNPSIASGNTAPRPFVLSALNGTVGYEILGISIEGNATNRTLFVNISDTSAASVTYPVDNLWHHVAIVGNDGTNVSVYIDGTRVANNTFAYDITKEATTAQHFCLGSYPEDTNPENTTYLGYLTYLLYDASTALYSGTSFTPSTIAPSTTASTVLLLLAKNQPAAFFDSSPNNFTPNKIDGDAIDPEWSSTFII